ncbi:hypothetical protein R6Z07M_009427 [Ovis aries]
MAGWSNYGNVRKCLPGSRTVSAKVEGGLSFLSSRERRGSPLYMRASLQVRRLPGNESDESGKRTPLHLHPEAKGSLKCL